MMESKESGKDSSLVVSHKETSPSCKEPCDEIKIWAIVEFDALEEHDLEGFIDLVPSRWITSGKRLCWYPMNHHKSSIEKLAKICGEVDPKWDCFPITIIENGIDNYNKGMRMLIKVSKNPNSTLLSDVEEKGKGRRKKKPNKRFHDFIDDTEDYVVEMRKKAQPVVPPIPKLASAANMPAFHVHKNKDNEFPKESNTDLPISKHGVLNVNSKNAFHVPTKNTRLPCKEKITQQLPFVENRQEPVTTISPASINKENIGHNRKGCKMQSKATHKCAYTCDGEVTLQSLADAICFLGNQLSSCKLMQKVTEKTINSLIESELLNNKSPSKEQPLPQKRPNLLDTFPLLTVKELKAVEKKLKNDDTYRSRLIESLCGEVMGDTLQKRINSIMRIIFDDKLASLFNWKGQRGEKQKLKGHCINKIMLEVMVQKFPQINETIFGRKAGIWLSQAPSRIQKRKCKNNGGYKEEDIESDDDFDADRCNNNSDENKYTKSDDDASKSSNASKSDDEEMES